MADLNRVLVGGSPSTGSSLLVNILNRHSAICSGPETYLFIHPKLYTDWATYKRYLLRPKPFGGLKSIGWGPLNGAILKHKEYGYSTTQIQQLIQDSPTLQAFADIFFTQQSGCQTWIEKSPSNVLAFPHFLESMPNAKVLLTLRDPYDTIASLVARGMHPVIAAAAYLVNNAFALRSYGHPRFSSLIYEEWIQSPKVALQPVLQTLDLHWEDQLLQTPSASPLKMDGWLQDERGAVQTGSIGRFQRLPA
ncbi:MAG: sulfotransferase, partial [Phaeodactylibacter sp.]|nr:sulfotransferase [Phaeodactylibacter sp.]